MQLAAANVYNNSVEWHEAKNVNVYSRRRQLAEEIMKVPGCSFDPNQVVVCSFGDAFPNLTMMWRTDRKSVARSTCSLHPSFISAATANAIRISPVPKKKSWQKH